MGTADDQGEQTPRLALFVIVDDDENIVQS